MKRKRGEVDRHVAVNGGLCQFAGVTDMSDERTKEESPNERDNQRDGTTTERFLHVGL